MHFHPGWPGLTRGFGHGGYYTGDDRYRYVGHQQDRRAPGPENRTVQNAKSDHSVFLNIAAAPGHWYKQEAPKDGSSADKLGEDRAEEQVFGQWRSEA
jgi:hypothetical protein